MRAFSKLAGLAGTAAILAACSFGGNHPSFDTAGVIFPPSQCNIVPTAFGAAEQLRPFSEGNGCGIANPWRTYSIANVNFSQPAEMNCGMSQPLDDWLQNTVQPAAQKGFGERVVAVDVLDSYSCRPRNGQNGARLSEHGLGNAIDIGAFTLESGRKISVEQSWFDSSSESWFVRQVRADACNDFMTVLGPGSDYEHRNHIHLDLEVRRNGNHYCH
jgi:hypothetical protein